MSRVAKNELNHFRGFVVPVDGLPSNQLRREDSVAINIAGQIRDPALEGEIVPSELPVSLENHLPARPRRPGDVPNLN